MFDGVLAGLHCESRFILGDDLQFFDLFEFVRHLFPDFQVVDLEHFRIRRSRIERADPPILPPFVGRQDGDHRIGDLGLERPDFFVVEIKDETFRSPFESVEMEFIAQIGFANIINEMLLPRCRIPVRIQRSRDDIAEVQGIFEYVHFHILFRRILDSDEPPGAHIAEAVHHFGADFEDTILRNEAHEWLDIVADLQISLKFVQSGPVAGHYAGCADRPVKFGIPRLGILMDDQIQIAIRHLVDGTRGFHVRRPGSQILVIPDGRIERAFIEILIENQPVFTVVDRYRFCFIPVRLPPAQKCVIRLVKPDKEYCEQKNDAD